VTIDIVRRYALKILYYNTDRDDVLYYLERTRPLKVAFHWDADGVASAVLINSVFKILENDNYPYSPDLFGYYPDVDLSLDLGEPVFENNFHGLCIDHHEHSEDCKYKLVWSYVPTGLIIYELLKEYIPDSEKWKVVVSVVGDGQKELVPDEVWELYPELWEMRGNVYHSYGKSTLRVYPLFSRLSSMINNLCRTGYVMEAYKLLRDAKSPYDVVNNALAIESGTELKEEIDRIIHSKGSPLEIAMNNILGVVVVPSKHNIQGRIASMLLKNNEFVTFVVVNPINKVASIRGVMAKYISNQLNKLGYKCGGHAGYCACTLEDTNINKFIHDVKRISI